MYNSTKQKRDIKKFIDVAGALLAHGLFIFSSDFGIKGVTDKKTVRLQNQLTKLEDVKVKKNYNLLTGRNNIADIDLDWKEALEVVDGGVDLGMGNTYCASTDGPFKLDADWNGADSTDTTNETNEDSDQITTSHTFPKGLTIYGFWDNVELNSGAVIVYVAPRHDYHIKARS